MEQEVKNQVKADVLTTAIILGGSFAISGLIAGVHAGWRFVHNRRIANTYWDGLTSQQRNDHRLAWIECNQDPDTFAKAVYEAQHGWLHIDVSGEQERMRILAKHLKKKFETPMEVVSA